MFAFDPADEKRLDNRFALAELHLKSRRFDVIVRDANWTFGAPRYSPDGSQIAFLAKHDGLKHTMPDQLAVWDRASKRWEVESAEWDHEVKAPLHVGRRRPGAAVHRRTERPHAPVALQPCATAAPRCWSRAAPCSAFDKRAGTVVTIADAADHPARATACVPGQAPRRIERFNDKLLAAIDLGRHEEVWIKGALGDRVQMWVFYPPGFDAKKKYPLLHTIHGGPHTAPGDGWHYRWNN